MRAVSGGIYKGRIGKSGGGGQGSGCKVNFFLKKRNRIAKERPEEIELKITD